MMKFHLFKSPVRIFTGLILLLCCLSTGAARAQCTIVGGNDTVCVGRNDTLSISGTCTGAWSSSNTSIATVSTSGIVTGVSAGSAWIYYATGTTLITVKAPANPGTVSGPTHVCRGTSVSLYSTVTGGTWSCSAPSIASVNVAGGVRGYASGTSVISYSVTNSCGTVSATQAVFVDTPPPTPACSYSGLGSCDSGLIYLPPYFSPSGGTVSLAFTTAGHLNAARDYFIAGSGTGVANIVYTLSNTCDSRSVTLPVYVGHSAAVITGSFRVCVGTTGAMFNASSGGTWSTSNSAIATIDTSGIVTGVSAGIVTITYSVPAYHSCSASYRTRNVTITTPAAITGSPDTICSGGTTVYNNATAGGTWGIISGPGVAVIGSSSGAITGTMPSSGTIATRMAYYYCGTDTVFKAVTVKPRPATPSVSGIPSILCSGAVDTVTGSPSGGSFYTGGGASPYASIGSLSGILRGTTTVLQAGGLFSVPYSLHYAITGANGCRDTVHYTGLVASPTVHAGTISGATYLCPGVTVDLSTSGDTFGTWSSSNPAVASADPVTGLVSYVSAGTATISYVIASPYICNNDTAVLTITNYPVPSAGAISDPPPVCEGASLTLSDYGGGTWGTWSSSDPSVATDTASGPLTGTATGISAGTATVYYTVTNPCGMAFASATLTVLPTPAISGSLSVCEGLSAPALSGSIGGGTWSSSDVSIATIDASGVVTGVSGGTAIITYTIPATGCYATASFIVNPSPAIGIGLNGNPPATFAAVICGNSINLAAYGAANYTWNGTAYLYYAGTSTPYVSGSTATSVDVHAFTLPILTYTITGTSAAGCVGTTTYSVVQPTCDAAFCTPFSGTPVYSLSHNIGTAGTTTYMPTGNYNVADTVKFLGTVHFRGNVLAIAPNIPVYVDTSAELYIDSSHLYCCDRIRLWNGIILSAGATTSGKLTLNHGNLIEDAKTAVKIYNGVIPATGYTLLSVGTTYNRNRTCIDINQYPAVGSPQPAPPYNYPFLLYDNVFTSRDLAQFVPSSGYGWPMQFPATTGTSTALKAPYTPTATYASFMPHYNIINPGGAGAAGVGYPYQALNDGSIANLGIRLVNVGSYATDTAPNQPATYNGITIGDDYLLAGNEGINLFDTLCEGIYALNSNLTSYNNTFMYMHRPPTLVANPTGEGITAVTPAYPTTAGATAYPKYNLKVAGSATPTNNQFFDCIKAVSCQQYYNVDIENCYVISYPSPTAVLSGQAGFSFLSRRFHDVTISGNELTNVRGAITVNTGIGGGIINQFSGNIIISNNTINSNVGGAPPVSGSGMAVMNGISMTNMFLSGTASNVYAIGSATVDNNNMNYVYNGIAVNGYHFGQPNLATNNNIRLNNYVGNSSPQYGISHRNCFGNVIDGNTINGPGYNTPTAGYTLSSAGKITGIYGTAINGSYVTCNYTGNTNVGFQFLSANTVHWFNNEMDKNAFGLAINGSIGEQGNLATPSNNVWRNTLPWWTGAKYNIFTFTATIPADTLYVDSNASSLTYYYDPMNNWNNPFGSGHSYGYATGGSGNGLYVLSPTGTLPTCLFPYSTYPKTIPVVKGILGTGDAQAWIAQYNVFEMIKQNASLKDSSALLDEFATMTIGGRYDWLSNIEAAIMSGDKSTANTLLAANIHAFVDTATDTTTGVVIKDGVGADYIVRNYVTLYNQYLKYMDSSMNGDDSAQVLAIANLCPYTYGNVVYQAQAFYRILYDDDTTQFDGSCDADTSARYSQPVNDVVNSSSYSLYPNPNDGSFMLRQGTIDVAPVAVTIKDVLGRNVYDKQVLFTGGTAQLQLNQLPTGVYMLQIAGGKQKVSNFKFVIQK